MRIAEAKALVNAHSPGAPGRPEGVPMRRSLLAAAAVALAAALLPAAAGAHPDELGAVLGMLPQQQPEEGTHDDAQAGEYESLSLVANWSGDPAGSYREGSDLAFWGTTAILGSYGNPGGFRVMDIATPAQPRLVGTFACAGPQGDVSIWESLVFVSVDTPQNDEKCGSGSAGATAYGAGKAWEGIRIVSIADPANPVQIAAVDTDCGSHTHTLVPDTKHRGADGKQDPRVLIYVSSYPLGGQGVDCNAAGHRKISIVEVPLRRPAEASVIATPDVSPAVGCHDITVFPERGLAAAACITESQLWDISDPAQPRILSHIANPAMEIHHSSAFSWDGDVLVLGDEMGGAAAAAGCASGGHAPTGSLWFYDVSDPAKPAQAGWYTIPQNHPSLQCTAHNFNVVPTRDGSRVLVTAWYNGGTHVLNFDDPANVEQLAYAKPAHGSSWSSYWYNGLVYVNNFDEGYVPPIAFSRGFDVLAADPGIVPDAWTLPHLNPQTQISPAAMGGRERRAARG